MTIPLSLMGQVGAWGLGFALMVWGTFGDGDHDVTSWALMCTGAAMSWTIVYALGRQHQMIARSFELGREAGEAAQRGVRPVR